ncbi:MAG: MutS-related protein [Sphingobacteriales bacterium]|jgi:DNA mismatch repair protein MutS
MQIDQYTYHDLSIFHNEEEYSVFHRLNFTRTLGGKEWLMQYFKEPFNDISKIRTTQQSIQIIYEKLEQWPLSVSNGTILVLEKFYDYQLDPIPKSADVFNSYTYRLLHAPDFSLIRFSLQHFADFFKSVKKIQEILRSENVPSRIQFLLDILESHLNHPETHELAERNHSKPFMVSEVIRYGHFLKEIFQNSMFELINIYCQFDAWYSMAMAMKKFNLTFPEIIEQKEPFLQAEGMYHLLIPEAIPYDVEMSRETNFIFLTGANMAGKSTFIKSVGLSVFLAHIGMGVPARSLKLSLFDGILSNINVTDNIVKGESFFYNEVQRIRNTVLKINDGRKWLVLIDELFKGTNIQDAMKCSLTVIRGLIKIKQSLFILSTHLYEIGDALKAYPNISFKYFETSITEKDIHFSYQLKEGVSNDRLGYLILQREGVVEMLDSIN